MCFHFMPKFNYILRKKSLIQLLIHRNDVSTNIYIYMRVCVLITTILFNNVTQNNQSRKSIFHMQELLKKAVYLMSVQINTKL